MFCSRNTINLVMNNKMCLCLISLHTAVCGPCIKVRLYRARTRTRMFSSWNRLVIYRGTVQIECERERKHIFVHANDRLDCSQRVFFRSSRGYFAINQSASTSFVSFPLIETSTPDLPRKS